MPKRRSEEADDPDWKTHKQEGSKSKVKHNNSKQSADADDGQVDDPGEGLAVRRKRIPGADGILFDVDCIFCKKSQPIKVHGKKQYPVPFKTDSYQTVQSSAQLLHDEALLLRINGVDLFAAEAHFHEKCRHEYNRKAKSLTNKPTSLDPDEAGKKLAHQHAYEKVLSSVKCNIVEKGEVVKLSDLKETYECALSQTCYPSLDSRSRSDQLRKKLEKSEFGKDLSFSSKEFHDTLVYNKSISTSTLVRTAYELGNRDMSKEVSSFLREKIQDAFKKREVLPWPTRPKDIPKPETEMPPEVLDHILNIISPSRGCQEHSEKTRRLSVSIAQDLCRAATNGQWKSEKHILLCMEDEDEEDNRYSEESDGDSDCSDENV